MKVRFSNTQAALLLVFLSATNLFAQQFELNPTGTSHIRWPFANSTWENRNSWVITRGPNEGYHHLGDYYADDWARLNAHPPPTCGQPFYSPLAGTVIYAGNLAPGASTGYGNQVVVQSSDDPSFASRVTHLDRISVSLGQRVSAGTKLGEIGTTGNSTACHAHCVLYKNINSIYSGNMTGLQRLENGRSLGATLSGGPNTFAAPYFFDAIRTSINITGIPNPQTIGQRFDLLLDLENLGASYNADLNLIYWQGGSWYWLGNVLFPFFSGDKYVNHVFLTYTAFFTSPPYVAFIAYIVDTGTGELETSDFEYVDVGLSSLLSNRQRNALRQSVRNFRKQMQHGGFVNKIPSRMLRNAKMSLQFPVGQKGSLAAAPSRTRTKVRPTGKLATTWGNLKAKN